MRSAFYKKQALLLVTQATITAAIVTATTNKTYSTRKGKKTVFRRRRTIHDVFLCLGHNYFQRAYRMSYSTFGQLLRVLSSKIRHAVTKVKGRIVDQNLSPNENSIPNGRIEESVRLGCALRYFAGGSPYDLMTTFGISHTEVFVSVWSVVEAINHSEGMDIRYPSCKEKQHEIAKQYATASSAGFGCCAGAIDGILIWLEKPTKKHAEEAGIGQGKLLCGRKHKFGLNCQAVSDVNGRILDISIVYGGASSDLLAFEGSTLHHRLKDGLLAEGLCLFGDNAYLNSEFMATPYANVRSGSKDDYNFYHSQLRIRVECAFGILVRRWGILRSAIPKEVTVRRAIALVNALAKLHNFCIDAKEAVPTVATTDLSNIMINPTGHIPVDDESDDRPPRELVGGGHHFEDIPRNLRESTNNTSNMFPRQKMQEQVLQMHLKRPSSNIIND